MDVTIKRRRGQEVKPGEPTRTTFFYALDVFEMGNIITVRTPANVVFCFDRREWTWDVTGVMPRIH